MAEFEPTYQKTPKDERDEVAKLQQKLERAQFDMQQKEAFGKYDVTVPNEGEDTYQSYLDQRPAEGVVRNGNVLQDAQTGKFASSEQYEAQKVSPQDHYDQIGNLVNTGEYEPPQLEAMGLMQLAKEASKARILGDRAAEDEVRAAVEHHLTADVMGSSNDTETPEEAQARFEAELAHYDSLVDRFINRADAKLQHAEHTHVNPAGEGEPSARATAEKSSTPGNELVELGDAEPNQVDSSALKENESVAEPVVEPAGPGAYYEGKKVSVSRVLSSAESGDAAELEVVDDGGEVFKIPAQKLVYNAGVAPSSEAPAEPKVATAEVEPASEVEAEESTPDAQPSAVADLEAIIADQNSTHEPGKELELYQEAEAAQEKSRLDRLKGWFRKERRKHQEYGGKAYWSGKWHDGKNSILMIGVDEEMTLEQQEKIKKRNRIAALVGIGVLAAGAIAAVGYGLGHASAQDAHTATGGEIPGSGSGGAGHTGDVLGNGTGTGAEHSGVNDHVRNVLDGNVPDTSSAETAPSVNEAFNISKGEGGEELFKNMGIDPSKWYAHENSLLNDFPQDFYRMADGHVGISHPGELASKTQQALESLKN